MKNFKKILILSFIPFLVGCKQDNDEWSKLRHRTVPNGTKQELLNNYFSYEQTISYTYEKTLYQKNDSGSDYKLEETTENKKYNISCSMDASYPWCVFKELVETTVDEEPVVDENIIFDIRNDEGSPYFFVAPPEGYCQEPDQLFALAYGVAFTWKASFFNGADIELFTGQELDLITLKTLSFCIGTSTFGGSRRGDVVLYNEFQIAFDWNNKIARLITYDLYYEDYLFSTFRLNYMITEDYGETYKVVDTLVKIESTEYTLK